MYYLGFRKKRLLCLLLCCWLFSISMANAEYKQPSKEFLVKCSINYVQAFYDNKLNAIYDSFSLEARLVISLQRLEQMHSEVLAQAGKLEKIESVVSKDKDSLQRVTVLVSCEKDFMRFVFIFNEKSEVENFIVKCGKGSNK